MVSSVFLLSTCTRRLALGFRSHGLRQSYHVRAPGNSGDMFFTEPRKQRLALLSTRGYANENVITSTGSKTVKKVQALLNKRKKRYEASQTIVEGPRMVFDLLKNPKTKHLVQQILVSTDQYDSEYRHRLENESSIHVQLVEPSVFKACTDTVTPQGIVAVVDFPSVNSSEDFEGGNQNSLFLVLDGISDPGNMGTLVRSSLAAGVRALFLLPGCCDVWNPKTVRSSMGASFQIPILEFQSWDEAVEVIQGDYGVKTLYAATMLERDDDTGREGSQPYFEVDWITNPLGLIVGSEGNGLSDQIRSALQDATYNGVNVRGVHIPMMDGIESLNAAVCGSVMAFEFARQRDTVQE